MSTSALIRTQTDRRRALLHHQARAVLDAADAGRSREAEPVVIEIERQLHRRVAFDGKRRRGARLQLPKAEAARSRAMP